MVFEKKPKPGLDFFPLTVNYQEKAFAAGKIPGIGMYDVPGVGAFDVTPAMPALGYTDSGQQVGEYVSEYVSGMDESGVYR